ncbi:DUF1493 family protein [Salmonella enterica]|nr:DUF1493 family protein [Salmonella enterica]
MTKYSTFNSTNKSTLPERDSAPAQSGMRAADGFFKAKFRCPEPKKKELTPSTDLDSDLQLEDDEVLALMDDFFTTFNVDKGNFSITTYYPPEPPLKHLLNPFRKNDIPQVPDFTIGMLIASARAGCWLYD